MGKKLFLDSFDMQVVTRYSIGHCRKILRKIRSLNRKQKHQKVTVEEAAEYLGISSAEIHKVIDWRF